MAGRHHSGPYERTKPSGHHGSPQPALTPEGGERWPEPLKAELKKRGNLAGKFLPIDAIDGENVTVFPRAFDHSPGPTPAEERDPPPFRPGDDECPNAPTT